MLDFLQKENISNETIDIIYNKLPSNVIETLIDNEEECLKIIKLLKSIGIKNIEDLLIYETYIFLKLSGRVADSIKEHDINTLVNDINEDYSSVENYI